MKYKGYCLGCGHYKEFRSWYANDPKAGLCEQCFVVVEKLRGPCKWGECECDPIV